MELILLERIEKLGQMGDVVRVRPGFARNYLLPQHKALRATKENMAFFEGQRQHLEAENLKRRDEAQAVAGKLDGLKVVLIRSAGESGQLYGSVTARDIAQAVTESGFKIDRSQVLLDRPLKALGLHDYGVRLHPEVSVTVTVNVARSQDEAELQAQLGRAVVGREEEDEDEDEALAEAESHFDAPESEAEAEAEER
ncbi:MAG: 50S ribosomal protein L9, partial [Alphaproteobacteria bacterium]